MNFGEKLYGLRKEHGMSQEALAEKLNTSRQAVSKWENGQGFPETEKLLLLGNLFEVSLDYLLKEDKDKEEDNGKSYYVSREMAEGYLISQRRTARYLTLGFYMLMLAPVPYLHFGEWQPVVLAVTAILLFAGIAAFIAACLSEEERYKSMKHQPLIFDAVTLKELKERYEYLKRKYLPFQLLSVAALVAGAVPLFAYLASDSGQMFREFGEKWLFVLIPLAGLGFVSLLRMEAVLDAWKILVRNEEYQDCLGNRLLRRLRRLKDQI